jgi:hypothetical protein
MGLYPPRKVEICEPNRGPIQIREKAPDLSKLNPEEHLRLEAFYKKTGVYELWGRKLVGAALTNATNERRRIDELPCLEAISKNAGPDVSELLGCLASP